jgi:hypothetical protein
MSSSKKIDDLLAEHAAKGIISLNEVRSEMSLNPFDLQAPSQIIYPSYTPLWIPTPLKNPAWIPASILTSEDGNDPDVCAFCGDESSGHLFAGCIDAHITHLRLCGNCLNSWENNKRNIKWGCRECYQDIEESRVMR